MSDSGNRTEKPTPRRLDRARKDGSFVSSREFVSAVQYIVFAALTLWSFQPFLSSGAAYLRALLRAAFDPAELSRDRLIDLFRGQLTPVFAHLVLVGFGLSFAAFAAQMAVSRGGIASKRLGPDLARLNPVPRLKEMGTHNIGQFFRSLFFLPLFLWVTGWLVWRQAPELLALSMLPWWSGAVVVGMSVRELLERAMYLFLLLGLVDWYRQHQRYTKRLRMTKQEVRDEFKEVEGNPQIKAKVRRMQRDMSRRRMMTEVPKASAVIVNPTHYAVAIRYDLGAASAPRVVAKGRNHLARRIREMARTHEIPIIENPPLARALYAAADVGQEIPPHLYKAVAEILAYLFRLFGGRLPGQAFA
ncbi:MAG: EscU/YscU/HrcU family type III secretion system export apparatus switch protein [Acidobacteria bacterium]|nr:EscU/YscU/HrcU family type III secretion system export apparatus switch protein [Acidobacteriota bacterium]